jgi:hypothetical protein
VQHVNTTGAPCSVISDTATVDAVRRFLADETKPSNLEPIDLLQIIYLMTKKAEDHAVVDSQQTLARRFNCSVHTIARSQKRLASGKVDYISRHRRRGQSSTLALNHENIPAEAIVRLRVSEDAGTLANWYKSELQRGGLKKRFPKHFVGNQKVSAQRILNECGGDLALAKLVIAHAIIHPSHRKRSADSLYNLHGRWRQIVKTFTADNPGTVISPHTPLAPLAAQSTTTPAGTVPVPGSVSVATAKHPVIPMVALADRIKRKLGIKSPVIGGKWEQTILHLTNQGVPLEEIGRTFDFISEKIPLSAKEDAAEFFGGSYGEITELMKPVTK